MSALSDIVKNLHDCATIAISDGSTPAKVFTSKDVENINIADLSQSGVAHTAYQTRRRTVSVRKGERVYPSLSFDMKFTSRFTTTGNGSILDMIHGAAGSQFAGRVSVAPSMGDVPLLNVTFTKEGTDYGDAADHVVVLQRCAIEPYTYAEGDPDTQSFTLICYGDVFYNGVKVLGDVAC